MKLRPTLAVLPLEGAPLAPATAFGWSDIAVDQLISVLSRSSMLRVISRYRFGLTVDFSCIAIINL